MPHAPLTLNRPLLDDAPVPKQVRVVVPGAKAKMKAAFAQSTTLKETFAKARTVKPGKTSYRIALVQEDHE